jgi:hypothetical protein
MIARVVFTAGFSCGYTGAKARTQVQRRSGGS